MLLTFEVHNFKSFKDGFVFNMRPNLRRKGLDDSLIEINGGKVNALPTSVIFGANSSGKSNVIDALMAFQTIVRKGNVVARHTETIEFAKQNLYIFPFAFSKEAKPISFKIILANEIQEKDSEYSVIEYGFSVDAGRFGDLKHDNKIVDEELTIDGKEIFARRGLELNISIGGSLLSDFSIVKGNDKVIEEIARKGLKDSDLFLANGFRNVISSELAQVIGNAIINDIVVIPYFNFMMSEGGPDTSRKETMENEYDEILKRLGSDNEKIELDPKNEMRLVSVIGGKTRVPSLSFDSFGTLKFFGLFELMVDALKKGKTLVIDEMDSSIHPELIIEIVRAFHDREVNVNNAQLIFNTHNPIYLDRHLFRREEIKLVERKGNVSSLYSLDSFKANGVGGVRNNEDLMKNYMRGKYGAIERFGFVNSLKDWIKEGDDEDGKKAKRNKEITK